MIICMDNLHLFLANSEKLHFLAFLSQPAHAAGAPGCPQFGSLLGPQYSSDYGELKLVSILIRDAV